MTAAPPPDDGAFRLAALRSHKRLDGKAEELFPKLVRYAARITGCPIALISVVQADRQWFPVRHGMALASTPREQSFCAHAILHPDVPCVVPDAALDPRFAHNPMVTGQMGIRFYAGVPLPTPEGHAVGALCVMDVAPRAIGTEALDALQRLAGTIRAAMDLRRMVRQQRVVALTRVMAARPGHGLPMPSNGDAAQGALRAS